MNQSAVQSDVLTHSRLCARAVRWLKTSAVYPGYKDRPNTTRCGVVLSELRCTSYEIPDAIGWAQGGSQSFLVECKTSRSDFRADQNKTFRKHPHLGMGNYRYYMAPAGVIPLDDVPDCWGLLEYGARGHITVRRIATRQLEHCHASEMSMLWSALRRVQNLDGLVAMAGYTDLHFGPQSDEHF